MCGEPGKTLDICTCTLYMEHGTRCTCTIARVLVHVYVETAHEHENSIHGHIHEQLSHVYCGRDTIHVHIHYIYVLPTPSLLSSLASSFLFCREIFLNKAERFLTITEPDLSRSRLEKEEKAYKNTQVHVCTHTCDSH